MPKYGLEFAYYAGMDYLCHAKKGRDGLCHQRTKTQTGHRTQPEFAKKETLRIVPQQVLAMLLDTVQLTYPKKVFTIQEIPQNGGMIFVMPPFYVRQ